MNMVTKNQTGALRQAPQWLDKSEYPFTSKYIDTDGHRMHYIDEGNGETIVFVHGTPSWSFDFRNVIKRLKSRFRCVAVDHIGFGLSDKPEHYDYSTQNHSRTFERFVQERQLDNFTLVVHDFGGPIALNYAIRHPEKVRNLVVLNSWLWSSAGEPEFEKLKGVLKSPLLPFLYRYLNLSARYVLPGSFGDHKLPRHILTQYTRPFENKSQRNGTLAFAKSLLNDQEWFAELWQQRKMISDKPALFIWGMKDPAISPKYLEKFSRAFANSTVLKLERSGHFPQEEEPEEVAEGILNFVLKQ
jgi:pimeloyl-ACP methyl ester carboxylesterase